MAERDGSPGESGAPGGRLASVTLDDSLLNNASPDIAHERDVAIYDLIADNRFALAGGAGPYALRLSIAENRLVFDVTGESDGEHAVFMLSLGPFRRIVRDYFTVCESYFEAIRAAPPSRIEAIDMGRRALHDEGSQVLLERLKGKVDMDFATARRLFTLVCALHWKG